MNERMFEIIVTSFPRILAQGLLVTIPLTLLSFSLAMVIAWLRASSIMRLASASASSSKLWRSRTI